MISGIRAFAVLAVLFPAMSALGAQELPLPELIPHLTQFRLDACAAPEAAFDRYANAATIAQLRDLGKVLCPVSDPSPGWQFFFGTSIAGLTSLNEQIVLTLFYNPWADVALLCEWTNPDGSPKISAVELVMGDILRKTKQPILTPLWRRVGDVPPQLAIVVSTSDTLRAFLDLYGKRALWGAAKWQGKLPTLKTKKQIDGNRIAVGALFSQTQASVYTFFNEAPFAPLKASMDEIRQLLVAGRTEEVLARAPETGMESRAILTEVPIEWQQATLVSLVTDPKNAFVFLASYSDPDVFACFWFGMSEDAKQATLKRIDFMGHNLSVEQVDAIARQAGMKR